MEKTKDKKIEKWIDLSALPRRDNGRIDWKKSEGYEINFKYGEHSGVIKILKRNYGTNDVVIYVDGYTTKEGISIGFDKLSCCKIGKIFKKPIAETHPHLLIFFYNQDDAYRYSFGSNKKVKMICPHCGTIKSQNIDRLVRQGLGCAACSDGISYPNKFIFNLLTQIRIDFKNEISRATTGFEWVGNYKYDFYFEKDGKKYFIEADGRFHHDNNVQTRDKIKNSLAEDHGIDVIRIDCDYHRMCDRYNFIKNNILSSKLYDLFDLSTVNWQNIQNKSVESYIIKAADLWNQYYKICDIASELHVSEQTITAYLKTATEMGCCGYNKEESEKRRIKCVSDAVRSIKSKQVALYKNNKLVGCFYNACELSAQSVELYGVYLHHTSIREICRGKRNHTKGYTAKYITYDEYNKLLAIQNEFNYSQEVI